MGHGIRHGGDVKLYFMCAKFTHSLARIYNTSLRVIYLKSAML
ncbi:hypothetical protein HMPREF3214_00152 [Alloscardovia omnicolens]|nr:hypothetical protein HMPREF3214_00152 [Alloscardovia omnicolens]